MLGLWTNTYKEGPEGKVINMAEDCDCSKNSECEECGLCLACSCECEEADDEE